MKAVLFCIKGNSIKIVSVVPNLPHFMRDMKLKLLI